MAWVETNSLSFRARHAELHSDEAVAVLEALEQQRSGLEQLLPRVPSNVTIVLHDSSMQLMLAQPWVALARRLTSPAGRRYVSGWFARGEVHCLSPHVLRRLAAGEDSLKALLLTPQRYFAMLSIGVNNPLLPPPFRARSAWRVTRRAWHLEGAAQYFSGQTPHLRAAIAVRLRSRSVAFPPSTRDAALLGGTVYDLLAAERERAACVRLACHPDPAGDRELLETAFGAPLHEIAQKWRARLEYMGSPDPHVGALGG